MRLYYFNEVNYFEYETLNEFKNIISDERRIKLLNFRNKEDSIRSFIGEILIRYSYEKECGELECSFYKNQFGKLFIKNDRNFQFNISHSGEWIICGIDNSEVGVDVEEIKDIDLSISEYVLNSTEIEQFNKLTLFEQKELFFKIWAMKESYIKAIGKGLSISMDRIEIVEENNKIMVFNKEENCKYRIINLSLDAKYKFSICKKNIEIENDVEIIHVSKEKIMKKLKKEWSQKNV